jgi:hypothetical protein
MSNRDVSTDKPTQGTEAVTAFTPGPGPAGVGDDFDRAVATGNELLRSQQPALAIAPLRKALEMEPGNLRVMAMLGLACFRAGQLRESQGVYQALVSRAPRDAAHRLNLGLVYLKLGNATSAIEMLEVSRSIDPSSGRAVHFLGLAYARAGRFIDAYRALLLAGQRDLATEIEQHLTDEQRATISHELPRRAESGLTEPPQFSSDIRPGDSLRFVGPQFVNFAADRSPTASWRLHTDKATQSPLRLPKRHHPRSPLIPQ